MEWWREAVFCELYVRSFQDNNGDGVGDLAGITQRLDHLNDGTPRSLGVDALWLTPINPSPMFDFGYDVADYRDVDPLFGSLADLDRLIAEAHRRNIRIILDLVPNHTSHLHPWFQASRRARTDPYRDWYIWRDPRPDGGPPNNWVSSFGGPAWTHDAATGQYYLHTFLAEQPDLNYRNPAVVRAMEDVIRFWLDRGVDGFRVDVIHKMVKDAALRDNPRPAPEEEHPIRHYGGQIHLHDEDQPEVHDIIRSWRRILDSYGERTIFSTAGDWRATTATATMSCRWRSTSASSGAHGMRRRCARKWTRWKRCCRPARSRRMCCRVTTRRATARASMIRCGARRGRGSLRCCCSRCAARRSSTMARRSACGTS